MTRVAPLRDARAMRRATMLPPFVALLLAGCSSTVTDDGGSVAPGASWTTLSSLTVPRYAHTATFFAPEADEPRVLMVGGVDVNGTTLSSVEILDIKRSQVLTATPLPTARRAHCATALADGRVLVTGGVGDKGVVDTVEIYDPDTGAWSETSPMSRPRHRHAAVPLGGGAQVLVTGGLADQLGDVLADCEIYDVDKQIWIPISPLGQARAAHTATLLPRATGLPDGGVLVAGGTHQLNRLKSMELYDLKLGTWAPVTDLAEEREGHAVALLGDGIVLIVGGESPAVELFDLEHRSLLQLTGLAERRSDHTLTPLTAGRALLVGGRGDASVFDYLGDARIFNRETRSWTPTARPGSARGGHQATLLPSGRVLLSGGQGPSGPVSTLELGGPFGPTPADAGMPSDADGTMVASVDLIARQ